MIESQWQWQRNLKQFENLLPTIRNIDMQFHIENDFFSMLGIFSCAYCQTIQFQHQEQNRGANALHPNNVCKQFMCMYSFRLQLLYMLFYTIERHWYTK